MTMAKSCPLSSGGEGEVDATNNHKINDGLSNSSRAKDCTKHSNGFVVSERRKRRDARTTFQCSE